MDATCRTAESRPPIAGTIVQRKGAERTMLIAATAAAAVILALNLWPGAGHQARAALAVIDNSNLAQNAATAARTAETLAEAKNILSVMKLVKDALGDAKSFANAGDIGGILTRTTGGGSVLGQVSRQTGIAMDFGTLKDLSRLKSVVSDGASVTDFNSAKRVVTRMFRTAERGLQGAAAADLEQARAAYYVTSIEDSAAAALFNRQTAADTNVRVERLLTQVKEAKNLNERMALNTTAVLMVVDELAQLRGLLATFAQMDAARNYAQVPVAFVGAAPVDLGAPPPGAGNVFQ